MIDNVSIKVYERGKLKTSRSGHNVWVDRGRQYIAEMLGYTNSVPTAERSDRVRYAQWGIGGTQQTLPVVADIAPLSVSYPAGSDPNATTGNEYRKAYPIDPLITTLERPVRITGGANPYGTAPPTDEWLVKDPDIFVSHLSLYEMTVHVNVDCTAGQIVYGTFPQMPLSEVSLCTDEATVGTALPFSTAVAYFSFDTILVNVNHVLELIWRVRFA